MRGPITLTVSVVRIRACPASYTARFARSTARRSRLSGDPGNGAAPHVSSRDSSAVALATPPSSWPPTPSAIANSTPPSDGRQQMASSLEAWSGPAVVRWANSTTNALGGGTGSPTCPVAGPTRLMQLVSPNIAAPCSLSHGSWRDRQPPPAGHDEIEHAQDGPRPGDGKANQRLFLRVRVADHVEVEDR